ncbi:hypothetical protein BJX76DRAFT_341530 [Aspergillus varians]
MTSCPYPARLLCLHRRSSLRPSLAAAPFPSPTAPRSGWRLQWSNQYSGGSIKRPVFDSEFLKKLYRLDDTNRRVPLLQGDKIRPWILLLNQQLSQGLEDAPTYSTHEGPPEATRKSFTKAVDLVRHISFARKEVHMDFVPHLGFKLNNWSAVYNILSRLVDAAEALGEASPPQRGVIEDWASSSRLSLDQLTDQDLSASPQVPRNSRVTELTSLDAITGKPYAQGHHMLLMAEVWKSLGTIIIHAADKSPNESKLAMSVVHRILARIHHSGLVSERVYRYTTPDSHQTTLRPPGMHLLSSHIMDVLSDAAWLVHEAEVAAKAAADGKAAPFLPAKIGIKELGHEIWLEFILWCCVEHGHINEGIWLVNQLTRRKDWKFQSWAPLLRDEKSLRNTRMDRGVSTWPNITPEPHGQSDLPLPFHGLGKKTISVEVAAALLDNLPNMIHLGIGTGVPASELLRHANELRLAITPSTTSGPELLPTTKATNWFTTRVMETGGLNPEADPQMFDDFLRLTPHVVPPWSNSMCPVEEETLAELHPSQLYDDTSAFTGLMEYNLKYHSSQKLCGSALDLFAMLQNVLDTCKMRRLNEFFSSQAANASANLPSQELSSLPPLESSNLHLSNVTMAHLFELVTTSRAFAFGEWLLLSDDVDGPTVPASAYGDQALAPSLLRFAAATKNNTVGEMVLRSLTPPIPLNTLRALLNYRIAMHQWDQAITVLKYIHDRRGKSWSHSNIATIAAEIIRLDHALLQMESSDATNSTIVDIETNLAGAKKVLSRVLLGEFDEQPWRTTGSPRFQAHALIGFTRLFRHMPSPSLHELADSAFESKYGPIDRVPYIPSSAFNIIYAAVAETKGTLAAKDIYERFCVKYNSPDSSRILEGGITRFYNKDELDSRGGNPSFDTRYFNHLQKKMIVPNPNTVRVLAQAAVREYQAAVAATKTPTQTKTPNAAAAQQSHIHQPPTPPSTFGIQVQAPPTTPPSPPPPPKSRQKAELQKTLTFCIKRFKDFRMRDAEIAREVGQELYSKYLLRSSTLQTRKDQRESSKTQRRRETEPNPNPNPKPARAWESPAERSKAKKGPTKYAEKQKVKTRVLGWLAYQNRRLNRMSPPPASGEQNQ